MNIIRIAKARPAVMYRWLRRGRYYLPALVVVSLLVVLPFGVAGGAKISAAFSANRALAATRAVAPEHSVLDQMSEKERAQHAAALSSLVIEEPATLYRLIGADFLVMFDKPGLVRHEGDAEIWQYRAGTCVLDLYFIGAAAVNNVAHFEVRPRRVAAFGRQANDREPIPAAACLAEIYES